MTTKFKVPASEGVTIKKKAPTIAQSKGFMCWRNYFRKENPAINYLLHIESNESKKNMVPEC